MILLFILIVVLLVVCESSSLSSSATVSSCSSYLCSIYKQEMSAYLSRGCVGNFSDILNEYSQLRSGYVSIGIVIFLGGCSFLFALAAGITIGRNSKNVLEDTTI